jgi:hypothetical protein
MKDFNNLDGVIENFDAVNAGNNVSTNYFDQDNFYPANGWVRHYDAINASNNISRNYFDQDNFYPANGEEYSNLVPLLFSQTRAGQRLVKGTMLDKKVMAENRKQRLARKDMQAKGQLEAAKGLAKGAESDKELLKALSPTKTTEPIKEKGLSMGAKIGIGVGIAAVLGIGAYFLLRKKK